MTGDDDDLSEGGDAVPNEDANDDVSDDQVYIDGQAIPWDEIDLGLFEDLEAAEAKEFADDSRRSIRENTALLRYIDEDFTADDFVLPRFEDPDRLLTYIVGIVEARRIAQDTKHRKTLLNRVMWFTMIWIGFVLAIVIIQAAAPYYGGAHPGHPWFHLSDPVMVALIGTTTGNVLGLAVIVLRGMFERDPPDHVGKAQGSGPAEGGSAD